MILHNFVNQIVNKQNQIKIIIKNVNEQNISMSLIESVFRKPAKIL